ncbi:MAG: M61 family peptidase [Bacteroidetes bacterium]|nr:M61 family peptidase [Bacteroidota bacterium]
MQYKLLISNLDPGFIRIESRFETRGESKLNLQLPSWRPGRYELANYAKNVRSFAAFDAQGNSLNWRKLSKDLWEINCVGQAQILVTYEYWAQQYDAGASYINADMVYVNPVNCFMYVEGRISEACTLELDVPDSYQIACQLESDGKLLKAESFDRLADSPFIASSALLHHQFEQQGCRYHFWVYGVSSFPFAQLEKDTRAYAEFQVNLFGDMPCKDYHFLYHILENRFRHGVEHADSTVIAMGPATELEQPSFYNDFLAISSHELFHLWNVKRIRPAEMWPYDFTRENYAETGYMYEGVTTYYGDLALVRSGVWTEEQYLESLSGDITRHLNNPGKDNYSLAMSSYDTWLDGYVPGVPGRKVSIYTEGLVAAWIADVFILQSTHGKHRMDHVMQALYESTWKQGRGYRHKDIKHLMEEMSGLNFEDYFKDIIFGVGKFGDYLTKVLNLLGLVIERQVDDLQGISYRVAKNAEAGLAEQELFAKWLVKAKI